MEFVKSIFSSSPSDPQRPRQRATRGIMRAASSSVLRLRRGVIAATTKLVQPLTTTDIRGSGTCAGGNGIEASIAASPQTILRGTLATFRRHASSTPARKLSAQRGASDAPASGVDPARHPELGERWGWSDAAHRYYYPLKALGVFSEKSTNALTSGRMLQTCLNNAERKEWYTLGKISNEFLPKLLWLSTNVWLLSRRLLREGERGKRVQELLFDELWRETRRQMRSIEVDEMMLKKYLGEAQQHTFMTLVQYDHAYTLENRDERMEILMAALWRGIFMGNEAIKDHHVRVIAEYMDRELADVYEIDAEDFFAVCIEFAPPPPFDLGATRQLTDTERSQGKPKSPAAGASSVNLARGTPVERIQHGDFGDTGDGRWRASLAESGKVYYWHTATRDTVWEKPPDSDPFVPSIMPKVVE